MKNKNLLFKIQEPKWKKLFSRPLWIYKSYLEQKKEYGTKIAGFGSLWWIGIYIRVPKLSIYAMKNLTKNIDSFFESKYSDIIDKYKNINIQISEKNKVPLDTYPIWIFWWQGEETMPSIVKKCYNYIKQYNDNVILITRQNVKEFVNLPESIYQKVESGKISYTHFSDILRLTLIAECGGMWIDATCYNPYSIPNSAKELIFYSPHNDKIVKKSNFIYWCDSGGWRSWNLGSCIKQNPLFSFCKELIHEIAIKQECMPNYFMVDCLISYAYRNFPNIKKMIDNMPNCNTKCADLFLLYFNKNKIYNEEKYNQLIQDNWIFKLTYKTIWQSQVNGKLTFYGKIFKQDN